MSNLGDLVYNLIGNSTSFVGANDRARASNDVLHGSVNSIIGQLMRQKKAFEDVGKSTLDYIAADKKASDEAKEHAVALMGEVNALKQLAEWRQKNASVANASRPYNERLALGMGDTRLTPTQLMANAAAPGRDLRQKELDEVFGLDPKRHADRKAQLAAATDQRIADEQDRIQSTALARQERRLTDSLNRQTELRLRQQAAGNALNDRLWFAPDASARQAADDKLVMQQLTDQGYFAPGGKGAGKKKQAGNPRQNFMAIEAGRFVEDFTQGSIYGGFKGGVLAGANNMSQMFVGLQSLMQNSTSKMGQAMANYGGIIGSVISTTMILGTIAVDSWLKASRGAKGAEEAVKSYDSSLSKAISRYEELRAIRQIGERPDEMSNTGLIAKRRELADLEDSMKQAAKEQHIRDTQLGITGISSDEMRSSLAKSRELAALGGVPNAKLPRFTEDEARFHNLSAELKTNEAIKAREEREGEVAHQLEKQQELKKSLLQMELEIGRQQRNADRDAEQEIEQGFARFQAHQRGGKGPRTDWEMIEEGRARRNAENQRGADKFGRGQSWFQSRSEDLLLSSMRDPKDQAAYRAEKERSESWFKGKEAVKMGIITEQQRLDMVTASNAKRDRDMREAKYGNLQADGASGFGSADIKSTQGFNAVIKAMRYAEQDKTIQQLKQNGDIAAEQLKAQQQVVDILNKAPIPVVDF